MDVYGKLVSERAPNESGKELDIGPLYKRSISLKEAKITLSFDDPVTWIKVDEVPSGYLTFSSEDEDGIIKPCQNFCSRFTAHTLEKVNNEEDGDCKHKVSSDFYPALHRLLKDQKNWTSFNFRGRANFLPYYMEWTELMMRKHSTILHQAEIFGAVAISRYPYLLVPDVWRAFFELWGPLSNTFHTGNGEMGISLYDLKIIGGLPILGVPYEEFIPSNKRLVIDKDEFGNGLYPSMVGKLLRVHTRLCNFLNDTKVTWEQWIEYFHRDKRIYDGIKTDLSQRFHKKNVTKNELPKTRNLPFEESAEITLAAFLALWLSRFVLPQGGHCTIRPETFYMASLMAKGVKVSLAPTVLGYIYHALNVSATHPQGPGITKINLPMHYVIGWLAEYFPVLYTGWKPNECVTELPLLAKYAGVPGEKKDIYKARVIFRQDQFVRFRPFSFQEDVGSDHLDNEDLSDERFELLVSMRSSLLPVRVGPDLLIEPYYPNRFARQFGLDQGVPANELNFKISQRAQCGIAAVAQAQAILLRRRSGSLFHIPSVIRIGSCTWWYCRWWAKSSTPYLGKSVRKVHLTLTKRPYEHEETEFVIKDVRLIYKSFEDALIFSSPNREDIENLSCKNPRSENDSDVNFKRARYKRPLDSDDMDTTDMTSPYRDYPISDLNFSEVEVAQASNVNQSTIGDILGETSHEPVQATAHNLEDEELLDYGVLGDQITTELNLSSLEGHISSPKNVTSMFGENIDERTQQYVLGLMHDILKVFLSSETLIAASDQYLKVDSLLNVLRAIVDVIKSGKSEFEWFSSIVDQIFELAKAFSSDTKLIHRHEECQAAKETLSSKLIDSTSKLEELRATEIEVKEAELKAQLMRVDYETKRQSLEEQINNLKSSLAVQDKLNQELQKSRNDVNEEKFEAIENVVSLNKSRQEKFQKLKESLINFCKQDT